MGATIEFVNHPPILIKCYCSWWYNWHLV